MEKPKICWLLQLLLLLLQLLQWLLLWLLQAVIRRPTEDRGNVAAGDLGEGWQFNLVTLLQPLGGLLWLLLLLWLQPRHMAAGRIWAVGHSWLHSALQARAGRGGPRRAVVVVQVNYD